MRDVLARTLPLLLAAAGVAAELNLLRTFIADWREESRAAGRKPRSPRRPTTHRIPDPRLWVASAAVCAAPAAALAQESQDIKPADTLTISTDRPSFSDGAGIQPRGRFNLETGYTFTYRDRDDVETRRHNAPEVLARLGIIDDRFELRFITSGFTWSTTDDGSASDSTDGWSDVALGFKLKLLDQKGWRPRLALGAQSTLGGGSDSISTQIAEPTFKLIWASDLGQAIGDPWKGFTLGGNFNLAFPTTDGDRFTQGQASLYLSFPIADRWTGFAEYYILGPNTKDNDAAHYTDFGATWLIHTRIQLDGRIGVGLNQEADNFFAGLGISFLF
ncbi:MAG: transporter [Phycisphaerales bacterium]|nr:transporter [Phycisphaerales bacterium]